MNKKTLYFAFVMFLIVCPGNTFTNSFGSNDFFEALLAGNLEKVKSCLEKEGNEVTFGCFTDKESDIFIGYGTSPIDIACFKGHLHIVKYLLENGSSNELLDRYAPIHYACMGGSLDVLNYLISLKVDVNLKTNSHNETPLAIACQYNRIDIVKRLIEVGADMHIKFNCNDENAILYASKKGNMDIVRYLLKMGDNYDDKNIHKLRFWHYFIRDDFYNTIEKPLGEEGRKNFCKLLDQILTSDSSNDKADFILNEILLGDNQEVKDTLFLFINRFFYINNLFAADMGGIVDQEDFCANLYAEFVIDLYKKVNNNKRASEILAQLFGFKENVSEKDFLNIVKKEFQEGDLLFNKKNKMKKHISDHEFRSNLYKNPIKRDVVIRCLT